MRTNYTVTGMTCGHCAAAITEEVSEIAGVSAVKVDHEAGSMVVTSDAVVDQSAIDAALSEAGDYTAVPV